MLDFGCGWGRLTRFLERDVVEPGALCGVDPVQGILDEAVRNGVRADLRRCGFVPEQLPFEQPFELAYAFSVFTHLSEAAHLASLRACTPPSCRAACSSRRSGRRSTCASPRRCGPRCSRWAPTPRPGCANRSTCTRRTRRCRLHTPGDDPGGEVSYGETVVTIAYVRERWGELFELVGADLSLSDPHQVALLLRRR